MRCFLTIVCVAILVSSSLAQIPQLINYQGFLADSTGTPVNGSLSMVFSIYDDSTGGVPVWMESHGSVSVFEGRFNVLLGSINPLEASVFDESDRYLGLAVNGDPEMQPRARISSTPYTYNAGSVASSSGGSVLLVGSASDTVQVDPYSGYAFRVTNDSGDERLIIEANDEEGSTISIKNPNGRYMTLGSGDSTVCIYGMDGGERVIIGMEAGDRIDGGGAVSVYDDSTRLAVSVSREGVVLFNGNARSDTMAIYSTDGNIRGQGWISMGTDSLNGPWSAVFGQNCSGNGTGSAVSGGISNHANGDASAIGGGQDNYVGGDFSAIPGGFADTIADGVEYSYLFGIDSDLFHDSTFMIDMPHIRFGDETDGYEFPVDDGSSGQVMSTDGNGQLSWTDMSGSDGDWTISGDNIYSAVSGNVGIGISSPTVKLHVYNISEGIEAYLGSDYSAVYGRNNIANCTGYFGTDNGMGVSGFGSHTGVLGWGTNYGVFGENDSLGNYGYLGGNTGYGVYGNGAVGVYGRGPNSGNFGYLGSGSYGVYGRADSGYAGYFYGDVQVTQDLMIAGDIRMGVTYPEGRIHVYDSDGGTTGYLASSNYGVYGENDSTGSYGYLGGINGYGVLGNGIMAGVYGEGPNPGNYAYLGSGLYGIYASADSGYAGYFDGDARITQNLYALGDVGIGTSIPIEKLQVDGRIFVKGNTIGEGITIGNWQSNYNSVHLSWQNNEGLSIHAWGNAFGDQLFIDGNSANVGIGTSNPDESLHIVGSIKIVDGTQGEGYLLVSDSAGVGRWENWGDMVSSEQIQELYDIIEQQNDRIAQLEKEIADIKSSLR